MFLTSVFFLKSARIYFLYHYRRIIWIAQTGLPELFGLIKSPAQTCPVSSARLAWYKKSLRVFSAEAIAQLRGFASQKHAQWHDADEPQPKEIKHRENGANRDDKTWKPSLALQSLLTRFSRCWQIFAFLHRFHALETNARRKIYSGFFFNPSRAWSMALRMRWL